MRIIKNFQDYYDNVAGNNKEDTVIYHRKTEVFKGLDIPEIDKAQRDTPYSLSDPFSNFCGSTFMTRNMTRQQYSYDGELRVETIVSVAGKVFAGIAVNEHKTPEMHRLYRNDQEKKAVFIRDKETFLSFTKGKGSKDTLFFRGLDWFESRLDLTSLHTKLNSPVLRITVDEVSGWSSKNRVVKYKVEKDPNLQLLNFQTILDPYTATQEIEMFVGGVLGSQNPEPLQTSDKDRLLAKGFDAKVSFRHRK